MSNPKRKRSRGGPSIVPNDCNANGGACWPGCGQGCPCDCHKTPGLEPSPPIWILAGREVTEAEYKERMDLLEAPVHPGHAKDEDDERRARWQERLAPIRMTKPFMPAIEPPESDEEREAREMAAREAQEKTARNPGIDEYVRDCVIERFRNLELD